MRSGRRAFVATVGLIALGALALPTGAGAATGSQVFTTPGEHAFVVPPGVTSLQLMLIGGNGGEGRGGLGGAGVAGATLTASLAVTPPAKSCPPRWQGTAPPEKAAAAAPAEPAEATPAA